METKIKLTDEFFELLNRYPSPHNGQPIELKQTSETNFDLYFDTKRGLQATEVSYLFSFVTMGLFVKYFSICAEAFGYKSTFNVSLPEVAQLRHEGLLHFASCTIQSSSNGPNGNLLQMLRFRQTSRKKYDEGLNEALSSRTIEFAAKHHMELVRMNRKDTHQAIWLNQRAVFDDMFDDAVRIELNNWLRYNKNEKESKMDGLAYDCMELNGPAMKFIVKHYKILRMPGIRRVLKKYYLRTMSDNSDVYYLLTPFSNEQESFAVGQVVMQIWADIASEGYYIHPFGTIMSNVAAHKDFLKLARIEHEDVHENFLVFIYRAGRSQKPHVSMRIPVSHHLLRSKHV